MNNDQQKFKFLLPEQLKCFSKTIDDFLGAALAFTNTYIKLKVHAELGFPSISNVTCISLIPLFSFLSHSVKIESFLLRPSK